MSGIPCAVSAPMTKRPEILVLCSRFPEPPVGGDRVRIYRICKEAAKHADLDLLTFCESDDERQASSSSGLFRSITRLNLSSLGARLRTLSAVPGSEPLQIAYYHTRAFDTALHAICSRYDATLAHLIRMGSYINKPIGRTVRVLEATDAISLNYSRLPAEQRHYSAKMLAYQVEKQRLLRYEKELPRCFDLLSFVSSVDVDFLYPDRPKNIVVATNGVDLEQFHFIGPGRQKRIVFIGNVMSDQNFDACLFFAKTVLPYFQDFEFQVIGRISEAKAQQLRRLRNVTVTGEVALVSQAAAGAFAAVCPVRMGAGVQNKLLEYFAMGIPAVSTSIGLEGLQVEEGRHVLRADDSYEMASALARLWKDPSLGRRLAEAGRAYVADHHAWDQVLSPLIGSMMEAVERRRMSDGARVHLCHSLAPSSALEDVRE